MRQLLLMLLLCGLAGAPVAETVDQIRFVGNRHFSSDDLSGIIGFNKGMEYAAEDLDALKSVLKDSLLARDFLFASADSIVFEQRGKRTRMTVFLHEGPFAVISSVRWLGDVQVLPRNILRRLLSQPGNRFRWSNLQFDIESLLDAFEEAGYPFSKIEILAVEQDSLNPYAVDVDVRMISGPFVELTFVDFTGNAVTKPSFLLRESRLKIGEPYSRRSVLTAKRYLRRLPFIRSAGEPRLVVNEAGETGLIFDLEEARMSRVDIVAGYSPGNDQTDGSFSGLVDLELLNFFGGGRKAKVHWERPTQDIQQIDLAYVEPWLLRQPLSAQVDFNQRIQDTLYVTRHFGTKLTVALSAYLSVWGALRREAVIVDSADGLILNLESSRTNYLETGFGFDSRDHPLNPRSGVYFSTFAGQGWRRVTSEKMSGGKQDFIHHRIGVDTEADTEFLPYWIVSAAVHARSLESDEPEIRLPDLYRLGGARSLRGYREEQFLGSRIGWASLELRYWLGPASRVFLFSDAGGAFRELLTDSTRTSTSIFKTSVGLGLRLETGLGVWGIDYGIGESDNLFRGKLHVSLYSLF